MKNIFFKNNYLLWTYFNFLINYKVHYKKYSGLIVKNINLKIFTITEKRIN